MAIDLTPEQREIGKKNFNRVVGQLANEGPNRRDFLKGLAAAGATLPISAAVYYGYHSLAGDPIKVGLIGAGDEGGVLVGEHNPEYLQFVAYSDIRPYNQKRIFTGEPTGPRRGFNKHYGNDADKKIKLYEDYRELLKRKDIDAVVIALPLFLHAPVAIEAMRAGKHVLCEKLMAWNITQCKEMIQVARETDRILAIGHQRHYSLLYAHAVEVMKSGVLGDVKHIRAQWHRNNTYPLLVDGKEVMDPVTKQPMIKDGWRPLILPEDRKALEGKVEQYGYKSMEELVRWRLYNRTGGGLMAELGSHQLDACSIFLGKVHPIAVSGLGGKFFYHDEREVDDHVFTQFEFPGKNYYADPEHTIVKDANDRVIVTYSSISTNSFEPYGECVMGDRGTMVVEGEAHVMLYPDKGAPGAGRSMAVSVTTASGSKPVLDASSTAGPTYAAAEATGEKSVGAGPVSRGYKEEMEHFAYCVRMWNQGGSKTDRPLPRCRGEVAMADAIIALTSNLAMERHQRIEFQSAWFDPSNMSAVPDPEKKAVVVKA
jgi:predicted dehydrogenase